LDFCDSENRNHIVETEKQLLETGLSKEFEEDLNMAISENNTEDGHDEKNSTDDESNTNEQDSENESLLSDENMIQDNSKEISLEETNTIKESKKHLADEEDETINEELNHNNESEQLDDEEDSWEDIYGRQRDKKGNIVSNKCRSPGCPAITSNISSDGEINRRLERQMKGILNRLAEQNMHTIANQVNSY